MRIALPGSLGDGPVPPLSRIYEFIGIRAKKARQAELLTSQAAPTRLLGRVALDLSLGQLDQRHQQFGFVQMTRAFRLPLGDLPEPALVPFISCILILHIFHHPRVCWSVNDGTFLAGEFWVEQGKVVHVGKSRNPKGATYPCGHTFT
jgi:hypothetical protein